MVDIAQVLKTKFAINNRYANFGPIIRRMTIDGFRGINGLTIEPQFPILAISGLNGSGKSTIGQIVLSAYRKPSTSTSYKRFYVRDFFPASLADPNPFQANASVAFGYETDDPESPQELTVRRAVSEWSGYKRQPERTCFYIGFTLYIPKVERKDVSIYRGTSLVLTEQREISPEIQQKVGRILGQQYDGLHFQGIRHAKKTGELGIATRFGNLYSENNMGFGEGRTLYMVDTLENSPEQSLFVIEEPETSLHEHAQHELAKYLMDVCNRRHHQIFISTHSDRILGALPAQARLLIHRDANGVESYENLSSTRARAILSLGYQRDLTVFVEDDFAKLLLIEMIRRVDRGLLDAVNICPVGDKDAVASAVRLMTRIDQSSMAVRDADVGENPEDGLFSFPGNSAPEIEIFNNAAVRQHLLNSFHIDANNELAQQNVTDHHDYPRTLADSAGLLPDYLSTVAVGVYLDDIGQDRYENIVLEIQRRA